MHSSTSWLRSLGRRGTLLLLVPLGGAAVLIAFSERARVATGPLLLVAMLGALTVMWGLRALVTRLEVLRDTARLGARGDLDRSFASDVDDLLGETANHLEAMRKGLRAEITELRLAVEHESRHRSDLAARLRQVLATDLPSMLASARRLAEDGLTRQEQLAELARPLPVPASAERRDLETVAGAAPQLAEAATLLERLGASFQARGATGLVERAEQLMDGTAETLRITRQLTEQSAAALRSAEPIGVAAQTSMRALRAALEQLDRRGRDLGPLADTIRSIDAVFAELGGLAAQLDEIAEQGELLALNAAIRAAQTDDAERAQAAEELKAMAARTRVLAKEMGPLAGRAEAGRGALTDAHRSVSETGELEGIAEVVDGLRRVEAAIEPVVGAARELGRLAVVEERHAKAMGETTRLLHAGLQPLLEEGTQASQVAARTAVERLRATAADLTHGEQGLERHQRTLGQWVATITDRLAALEAHRVSAQAGARDLAARLADAERSARQQWTDLGQVIGIQSPGRERQPAERRAGTK